MKSLIKTSIITAILVGCSITYAQQVKMYSELIHEAEYLYENEEYYKSGLKYSEAFKCNDKDMHAIIFRYDAACSWALANETDSAFTQLFTYANNLYSSENITHIPINYFLQIPDYIPTDEELISLHNQIRWNEFMDILVENRSRVKSGLKMELVAVLDTIYKEDQEIREPIDSIVATYGWESQELKEYHKYMHKVDSLHLMKVESILAERGWLGADVIGYEGNLALWLVIQHSPLDIQEKYLPMMRDAVKNGNARPDHLAYLEDRVAMLQGKKQVYGTQIATDSVTGEFLVSSLVDPLNVDKRRDEVGLGTLQEYIAQYGLSWDLEAYKKNIAESEAEYK